VRILSTCEAGFHQGVAGGESFLQSKSTLSHRENFGPISQSRRMAFFAKMMSVSSVSSFEGLEFLI
jgi:hypothetical protein